MDLFTLAELKKALPCTSAHESNLQTFRQTVKDLILGKERKIAIIVGPCSIHDFDSAIEYAHKIKKLSAIVQDTCFLVMRVYVEKSRTTTGWKGFLYDPDLDGTNNISKGIYLSRKLFLELTQLGIPIATEFVDPFTSHYFEDLITWGFIGARSSTSQPHRQLASSFDFPIGCKNDLSGDIHSAIETVASSRSPHVFLQLSETGQLKPRVSQGNPWAHVVLRGGRNGPNYHSEFLNYTHQILQEMQVESKILIDCAHGNSQKQAKKQRQVALFILQRILEGDQQILGIMLESHLKFGNQKFSSSPEYGVSITDPCIDWSVTEELLLSIHSVLSKELVALGS